MSPQPARVFRIETTWIREYARTYLPSEAGFSFSDDDLRSSGITLVSIRHVLRHGDVVSADKLDEPGAEWVIEGQDNEGVWHRLTLKVVSDQMDVTLIKAEEANFEEEKITLGGNVLQIRKRGF